MTGVLSHNTITVEGDFQGQETREYWLYEPNTRASAAPPLVIIMHGGGGQGDSFANATGLISACEAAGWVALVPQGLSESWRHTDDPDKITDNATANAGDDMEFFRVLWQEVIPHLGIDTTRIYMTGVSAGGMMAYRVAGEQPGGLPVRALGMCSTTMTITPAEATHAAGVHLWHVQGSLDTRVPITGGGSNATADYPPVTDGIDHWRTANNCGAPVETVDGVVTTQTSTGDGGVQVVYKVKSDGTHDWYATAPVTTDEIMAFFAAI